MRREEECCCGAVTPTMVHGSLPPNLVEGARNVCVTHPSISHDTFYRPCMYYGTSGDEVLQYVTIYLTGAIK